MYYLKKHGLKNVFGKPIDRFCLEPKREKNELRPKLLPPLRSDKEEKSYEKLLKLVDTNITIEYVSNFDKNNKKETKTYFIMSGFKKGIQMASGEFAQGQAVLQIFQFIKDKDCQRNKEQSDDDNGKIDSSHKVKRILYRELSNLNY